jgi:hypothetical protein
MPLRLAEAQQLHDGLDDSLLRPALQAFFEEQRMAHLEMVVRAVCSPARDTMKEARLAGKVEAYETALMELTRFAKNQLKQASQ